MTQIRQLTAGTAELLLQHVAPDVFDEPIDPARLAKYVAAPGHVMFLALDDGQVVGQLAAVMHHHPDKPAELYIDEVGVSPAWQRRGIARRLMDAIAAFGREQGCDEIWVGTDPDNGAAQALYGKHAEGEPFLMYAWPVEG
jgi:ribosomal protein S18 acetylase RimI-like enzyme